DPRRLRDNGVRAEQEDRLPGHRWAGPARGLVHVREHGRGHDPDLRPGCRGDRLEAVRDGRRRAIDDERRDGRARPAQGPAGALTRSPQWHVPLPASVSVPPATGTNSNDQPPADSTSRSTPYVLSSRTRLLARIVTKS